ncbi:MAG: Rnf-Nqr domain containing protein [Oscillospiraceae bacterium]
MPSKLKILTNGILNENPVLRLVLGTIVPLWPPLTMASNGIGMGLAATFVLVCSNIVISALRKVIPDQVRIPCYITVIAGFVSVVQMLVKAFVPALDSRPGRVPAARSWLTASSWAVLRCSLPRTASA